LRVPFGFLLLGTFAWLSQPAVPSLALGLPVCLCGLSLRAWSAGHLAKNQRLATSGPYAYIRNPLYAGTLLVAAGIAIASRSASLDAIFATVFLLVYFPVIEVEEQYLREIFPSYAEYAGHVHRLLPLRKWDRQRTRFSWALYRRNEEYKGLLGFLLAVALLVWKCGGRI
jgi:protein-S-isoprenylcysteine O-methyltransferase Ste14